MVMMLNLLSEIVWYLIGYVPFLPCWFVPSVLYLPFQFEICSSSVRRLLFLCLKSALPQFEICPPQFVICSPQFVFLWLLLNSLQNSHTIFCSPTNFFLLFGIWGKQDGTSNCAWGWRGQRRSSPALGSPQPPPRCHSFSSFSLTSFLTNSNISL